MPDGVDPDGVTWDPALSKHGGYWDDTNGNIIIPRPGDEGGWDHWQTREPGGRSRAFPGNWAKPGHNPKVPASSTDPWPDQSVPTVEDMQRSFDEGMDRLPDVLTKLVRLLGTPHPMMLPPIPGYVPVPVP